MTWSAGHLQVKATKRLARAVAGEHDLSARLSLSHGCQRRLHGVASQVHGDPDPREHRRAVKAEGRALNGVAQRLLLEIDRGKDKVVRCLDAELAEPDRLARLRSRMIDLEDSEAIQQIASPVGKRVQARAEDHVLLDASARRGSA